MVKVTDIWWKPYYTFIQDRLAVTTSEKKVKQVKNWNVFIYKCNELKLSSLLEKFDSSKNITRMHLYSSEDMIFIFHLA